MRLSITETRRRLPELVRQVGKNGATKIEITVHDEVVAELRSVAPEPEPGAAARALLAVIKKLPKPKGPKTRTSTRVKEYLYGSRRPRRS